MAIGLSGNGIEVESQQEFLDRIKAGLQAQFPDIDLDQGPEQQLASILSEKGAQLMELAVALWGAFGEDASGLLLDRVAAITGTIRRPATKSRVTAQVTLDDGTTLPAGSQAHVDGNPDAVFETVEAVTNSSGGEDTLDVVMEATETGPIQAQAGTLTEIVTSVTGWNSVTNGDAATLGKEAADDVELHSQRRAELASGGQRTIAAIRSNVAAIDGVEDVLVKENTSETTDGDGRPPKSIEVIVWDGSPPDTSLDDTIAQTIWDTKAEAIEAHGDGESGTAEDDAGNDQTVAFTRVTVLEPTVTVQVVLEPGTAAGWEDDVENAIRDRGLEYGVGELAHVSHVIGAVEDLAFVDYVHSWTLGGGVEVGGGYDEIVRLRKTNMTVSEFTP